MQRYYWVKVYSWSGWIACRWIDDVKQVEIPSIHDGVTRIPLKGVYAYKACFGHPDEV